MILKIEIYIIVWLSKFLILCQSICSPLYGGEPCTYVPAPPGKTPPCAHSSLTYCEYPDQYPGQLIHHLVKKWKFDHSTLFTSESQDDFTSYIHPTTSPVYGPPNYHPPASIGQQQGGSYPEPIYIPKPQVPFHENGINYVPPNIYSNHNFSGYPDSSGGYNYNPPHKPISYPSYQQGLHQSDYGQYDNIWKRALYQNYRRFKRSLRAKRQPILQTERFSNGTVHRIKRQSTNDSQQTLCTVRTQYIVPRAALNNKGNWMYVVNMPDVDNRVTQLVKSETCVSETCSGICSLPNGYSSRCEQKYVQKKLVALEGGGNQLYTDVFWFPSCCVCTISNN